MQASSGKYKKKLRPCGVKAEGCSSEALSVLHNLAQTPSRTESRDTIQDTEHRHHLGQRAETPSRTQSTDAIQDREHRHHLGHRAQTPSRTQTWRAIVGRLLPELHVDQGEIKRIHPMLKYSNNRKSMSYHIFTFSNNKSGSFSDAVKSSCQFSISIQISMS